MDGTYPPLIRLESYGTARDLMERFKQVGEAKLSIQNKN